MVQSKKAGFQLETALTELIELVTQLETGQMSLEDSLKAFERGVKLTSQCQKSLHKAEQKVRILMEQHPMAELTEFADEFNDNYEEEEEEDNFA